MGNIVHIFPNCMEKSRRHILIKNFHLIRKKLPSKLRFWLKELNLNCRFFSLIPLMKKITIFNSCFYFLNLIRFCVLSQWVKNLKYALHWIHFIIFRLPFRPWLSNQTFLKSRWTPFPSPTHDWFMYGD